ncbi:MAG: dihydrodipicolinate synthase family protein [Dehalococcoidia bacterium]|nr:dihydrodipicolinate synthase family protein [Dehalococcoidia bacterium]
MPAKNPSTYVISLTCFNEKDEFDKEMQRAHFKRLAASGIGVYVGGGGSGEAFVLSPEEYRQLVQVASEELKGKVPFRVMGREPRSAKEFIGLYEISKPYNPDAIQLYSLDAGHGRGTPMRMLEAYFRDLLDAIPIPCVLSSHQAAGYFIPIPMLKALKKEYKQIIGFNVTNPDIRYLTEIRAEFGDSVELHVGGPVQALQCLVLGGQGFLTSEANLVPKLCVSIIEHYKRGDMQKCFDAYAHLLKVFWKMSQFQFASGAKPALQVLGLPGGVARRPRLNVSAEEREVVRKWVEELRIKEIEGIK